MKSSNLSGLSVLALFTLAASSAAAQGVSQEPGVYLQANLGSGLGGTTHISAAVSGTGSAKGDFNPDSGLFTSVAAGESFKNGLAMELEGVYARNDINTSSLDTGGAPAHASLTAYGALANVIYAVGRIGPVVPYVGAGLGYGGVRYDLYGSGVTDNGMMWQLRAGVSYPMTSKVSLDLGYRYLDTPRLKDATDIGYLKVHTGLHALSAGVRVRF